MENNHFYIKKIKSNDDYNSGDRSGTGFDGGSGDGYGFDNEYEYNFNNGTRDSACDSTGADVSFPIEPLTIFNYKDYPCSNCGEKYLGYGKIAIGNKDNPVSKVEHKIVCMKCFHVNLVLSKEKKDD